MKRTLLLLLFSSLAWGQRPQPFVAGGFNLFDEVGTSAVGGLWWSSPRFTSIDEAGYETGGKSNDLANKTHTGHDRYLRGEFEIKVKGFGFGPGISWSKSYTPAYNKTHVHPKVYAAFPRTNYYSRLTFAYVHPGTDWQNGVQGFEGNVYWGEHHLFLRVMGGGYWCHVTVTDRTNKTLTASQKSSHQMASEMQTVVGWRF